MLITNIDQLQDYAQAVSVTLKKFNQAKAPGFFGWPYFIADNQPYNRYNSEDKTYGEAFDATNPVNESVNNTGIKKLPPPIASPPRKAMKLLSSDGDTFL